MLNLHVSIATLKSSFSLAIANNKVIVAALLLLSEQNNDNLTKELIVVFDNPRI